MKKLDQYNKRSLEEFKNLFYKIHEDSPIKILGFSDDLDKNNCKNYVIVENKYGVCKVIKQSLLRAGSCSIVSSINKKMYFTNQLKERFPGFETYFTIKREVDSNTEYCFVENIYGVCKIKRYHLLNKVLPSIQSAINKTEYFIKQVKEVHGSKYDYSLTCWTKSNKKVKIICKKHGIFEKTANAHLSGSGCKKCSAIQTSIRVGDNPSGWSRTNWAKSASKSKYFNSFKVYVIKCFNENEVFYKIGRTYLTVKNRFKSFPYKYEIIKTYEFNKPTQENSNLCYDLENTLKKNNKEFKYIPKIKFCGMQECFIKIVTE